MTPILLGFGLGLFAAAVIVGYRRARRIYWAQYQQELDDRIPAWVNQGNRAVIGTYDDILHAIIQASDFELWEYELEDQ